MDVDPVGNYCLNEEGGRSTQADGIANNPFPSITTIGTRWSTTVRSRPCTSRWASGVATTNFNASFENTRNEGVIFGLGGYARRNVRLNLDHQVRPNLDASFSTFYGSVRATAARPRAPGRRSISLMFVQPDVDITACCNPDSSPYMAEVPLSGDVANDANPMYELANRARSRRIATVSPVPRGHAGGSRTGSRPKERSATIRKADFRKDV